MYRVWRPDDFKRIQPGSKLVTIKGVAHVRYRRRNGETVLARVAKKGDGQFCLVPRHCYYVQYRDADGIVRTVKGYSDLAASQQLGARLERQTAEQKEGLSSGYDEHLCRPLAEHLADYR